MAAIHFVAILMLVILPVIYIKTIQSSYADGVRGKKKIKSGTGVIGLILLAAFIIRLIAAGVTKGHDTDMNCFIGWGNLVYENGFSKFYTLDAFTDYPPGYMYVLYLMGALRHLFKLGGYETVSIIMTKLPAVICDLVTGWLIYKAASKKWREPGAAACAAVYLLNPVIILNSAVWGQVDAVFTLAVVFMCYFITEKKLPCAYFAFAAGILIKPQTLIFAPVLLFGIIDQVFVSGFDKKNFFYQLKWGLLAILAMVLLAMPFGLSNVVKQYTETLGSYPYATINGYNLWAMLGLNWSSQEGRFLFLSYSQWGTLFIVLTVAAAAYLSFRSGKEKSKYYLNGAFIVIGVFMLSVRMHERYMFPAIALLLLAFIERPKKELYVLYVLFSTANFYNTVHVLTQYDYRNFDRKAAVPMVIAAATVIIFILFLIYAWKNYTSYRPMSDEEQNKALKIQQKSSRKDRSSTAMKTGNKTKSIEIKASKPGLKLRRWDIAAILIITAVYSFFAFRDLGDRQAPETSWDTSAAGDSIILDMGSPVTLQKISYFLGNYERRQFSVECSETPDSGWSYIKDFEMTSVFSWGEEEIQANGRYIRLTSLSDKASLKELVLVNENGEAMIPVNYEAYSDLFDEQNLYPDRITFQNGTYFDEIYHARTAYEYIHGLYSYENTHPPLGKIFISLGIRMFGMNPFGWRIMGTLFGIGMLPFIYLFAKRLFKESWLSSVVTVLFAFDFMHFTQTRIATIDVFVTFFVILMYYFMYRYISLSFYDTALKKTWIPLGLSGIFMGLGIASKWTGVYAGAGLAVIFFWNLYKRYREYKYAAGNPKGRSNGIEHQYVIDHFREYTIKTIWFCVLFFGVIPVIIYTLSYIPFVDGQHNGLITAMLKNQQSMFNYHSGIDSTHPYSSWWYQWPIMYRPIWYYSGHISDTISEGISAFGNPLVWWTGIPAFGYMVYLIFKERDKKAFFLCIAYLAQYVPWFFVTRITFIYHYFPSVPFVVLMIGYAIYRIFLRSKKKNLVKTGAFVYAGAAVVLFIVFYPVLSGQPIDKNFVFTWLRWFNSWVLVS